MLLDLFSDDALKEIILHTLFESGITRVYDLERYVKDDVVRFGARMTDLEKKLGSAYLEAVRSICLGIHSYTDFGPLDF